MKKMTLAQAYKQQFGKVSYPFEVFDANGNKTYVEDSTGYWLEREYDANGNETYFEDSKGYWLEREYDANGKMTYFENSKGYWWKREYDANGNRTYYENSDGRIEGQKQSTSSNQTIEIDGVKYSAELVRERIAELKPMSNKWPRKPKCWFTSTKTRTH